MAVAAAVPQVVQLISDGHSVKDALFTISNELGCKPSTIKGAYYRSHLRSNLSSLKPAHGNCKLTPDQLLQFDLLTRIFAGMDLP